MAVKTIAADATSHVKKKKTNKEKILKMEDLFQRLTKNFTVSCPGWAYTKLLKTNFYGAHPQYQMLFYALSCISLFNPHDNPVR